MYPHHSPLYFQQLFQLHQSYGINKSLNHDTAMLPRPFVKRAGSLAMTYNHVYLRQSLGYKIERLIRGFSSEKDHFSLKSDLNE